MNQSHLVEEIIRIGYNPKDWEDSNIINLYKGIGVAVDHSNNRGLKPRNVQWAPTYARW